MKMKHGMDYGMKYGSSKKMSHSSGKKEMPMKYDSSKKDMSYSRKMKTGGKKK